MNIVHYFNFYYIVLLKNKKLFSISCQDNKVCVILYENNKLFFEIAKYLCIISSSILKY